VVDRVSREGAVVGGETDGEVCVFEVAAWFEAAESLGVEGRPGGDGAEEEADVDVVEVVGGVGPGLGGVFEDEGAVWGGP